MAKILGNTTSTTLMAEQTYNPKSDKPQSGKAVAEAIAKLLGSAPETLDTLEELAKALDEDENFSATVLAKIAEKADQSWAENMSADVFDQIEQKVDKVDGMGLSANDFTDEYKEKVNHNTFDYYIEINQDGIFEYDRYTNSGTYLLCQKTDEDYGNPPWQYYKLLTVVDGDPDHLIQTEYDLSYGVCRKRDNYDEEMSTGGDWNAWWDMSVSSSYVTEKINKAIGDVETALENIIAKYGLGGDAQ